MVKKKRVSKRMSLHDKYKIQKKVTQHKAKERRAARKKAKAGGGGAPGSGSSRMRALRKDPGIPNLWPYKEQLLRQIEARRERAEQQKVDQKEARRAQLQAKRNGPSAEELANAAQRSVAFDESAAAAAEAFEESGLAVAAAGKRQYMRELRNVVEAADVVLQVLDARDPMGCRAEALEQMVMESARNKRLVLVLNKIDLVPREVAEEWLKVLRQSFPTVAFKASTQQQASNLGRVAEAREKDAGGSAGVCVGAETLLQLLKNYSRNKKLKTAITVGVVGYPNVGKSSLINSLKRCRAASVSPTPGHTKTLQVIALDKKIKLIDSPGVLFEHGGADSALVLRNCVDVSQLDDPREPVQAIVGRCKAEQLMEVFKVARFKSPAEFLALVAKKRGKLKGGGVPDLGAAARIVLQDWNAGKIPFYTLPPTAPERDPEDTEIVQGWSKEFSIEDLLEQEEGELNALPDVDMDACVGVQAAGGGDDEMKDA